MTFSKGKFVVGGIATYAAAVFVGYQYAQRGKPQEHTHQHTGANGTNINSTSTPFDVKNIVLQDNQRLESFNRHAKSYDSGTVFSVIHNTY